MKLNVNRVDMWAAPIEDRPAGLAEKLEALHEAGANLEFVMARRTFEEPGKAVIFLAPLKGAKLTKAAAEAGFHRTEALHSVRIEGADAPGLAAKITRALAGARINLRGFSASVVGKTCVSYLAVDEEEDARKAVRVLRKL